MPYTLLPASHRLSKRVRRVGKPTISKSDRIMTRRNTEQLKGILNYINSNPGTYLGDLRKQLKIPPRRIDSHISKLMGEDIIFSRFDGDVERFYPLPANIEALIESLPSREMEVVDIIIHFPGSSYEEIAGKYGKRRQTDLYYHMKNLINMKTIKTEWTNGEYRYFLN